MDQDLLLIFKDYPYLSNKSIQSISSLLVKKKVEKDTVVLNDNTITDEFIYLTSGLLKVCRKIKEKKKKL